MSSELAAAFKRFCAALTLDNGSPMSLDEFQQTLLRDFFDGTRETLVLLPKKNGKTTLLSALALFHLITTPDAECVIGAASRDQATILYDQAAGFVRRSPGLDRRVEIKRGYREIQSRRDAGRIRVLAADVDTADGIIPTLALVDELHRHRSAGLYGIFRDGLGPRDGQMITISTAGEDEATPLGELRTAARKLPHIETDGRHTYAHDGHGVFAMHEWALRDSDDRDDMRVVKLANPARWQTKESLRARHDSPSMTPWQWGRFACGIWALGQESAISPTDWGRCYDPDAVIPDGAPCWLGLDMAFSVDTTALVPLWMESDDRRVVGPPVVLVPPGDGTMLDERAIRWALLVFAGLQQWDRRAFISELDGNQPEALHAWADAIEYAAHPLTLQGVVYDPNAGAQVMVQQLDRETNLLFVEHSQDNAPMALASQRLSDAIPRLLRHNGDPTLRSHALTAVQKWLGGEKWKYDRPRGRRRPIDALTALEFAHSVAVAPPVPIDLSDYRIVAV